MVPCYGEQVRGHIRRQRKAGQSGFLVIGDVPGSATTSEIHLDTTLLLWGFLFGTLGLSFFVYGKKQKTFVPFVCGLLLMVFPYFVTNTILLVTMGGALVVIPFVVKV